MKLFASCFLLLLIAISVAGQTPVARKFDEFTDIQLSYAAARLDNFANQLQSEPQTRGFVIAYRSRRDLPGASGSLVEWLKNYLVMARGLSADRIVAIDGGAADCLSQELWLVPPGTTPAIRKDVYARTLDSDRLQKYYEEMYSVPNFGPESYSFDIRNAFEGFATALHRQPKIVGYLIAYAGIRQEERGAYNDKGTELWHKTVTIVQPSASAKRALRVEKSYLVKKYEIAPARLITIFGGYREVPIMELWIGPRGGLAPRATPTLSPKQRR